LQSPCLSHKVVEGHHKRQLSFFTLNLGYTIIISGTPETFYAP
jgi:hypothetical protein